MKTSLRTIAGIVARQSLGSTFGRPQAKALAAYLLSEHRTGELNSLLRDVQETWAEEGTVEVTATSARPLTEGVEADIEREVRRIYPNAKRIVISPRIDPSVIGGVRLSFVDYQLDLTIAGEVQKFKSLLTRGKDI